MKNMRFEISKTATTEELTAISDEREYRPHWTEYTDSRLKSGYVFIGRKGEDPAGFLIYSIWWGNTPFIELIKIKSEYQKHGLGTLLLRAAAEEIRGKGFHQLVSSTEVTNKMGLNFHAKAGFEKLNVLDLPHGQELFFKIALEHLA